MTAEELYHYSISLLPVKPCEKEFRLYFNSVIRKYYEAVTDFSRNSESGFGKESLARLYKLCEGLKRAVKSEYEGCRHSAFVTIKNQIEGKQSKLTGSEPYLIDPLTLSGNCQVRKGTAFYRMRVVKEDERYGLDTKGMFHIPLSKKGDVKTQRYSVPGFPCLYLGLSLYGCWEEMLRPSFGTVMVSKLVLTQDVEFLDLRVPAFEKWKESINDSILFFPLIIASMFQCKDNDAAYKPEYLIPQLITEWVISYNNFKRTKSSNHIIGIIYTSVHMNSDFNYPDNVFDNVAIPVLKPLNNGTMDYCPRLAQLFEITPPTYYELETLRQGKTRNDGKEGLPLDMLTDSSYATSCFGEMERYLDNIECHTICPKRMKSIMSK